MRKDLSMARFQIAALAGCLASALCTPAMAVDCGPDGGASPEVRYIANNTGLDFRALVLGVVGNTPKAGSALQGLAGFFWKQDTEASAVFDQMKAYVDTLVPELIARERVIELEKKLVGLHQVLKDYNRTSYGTVQKGQWFTSLLSDLDKADPFFFDERNPEKTLTYFVPMGTLRIAALEEQYLYYDRIYGQTDPDRDDHLKRLKDVIGDYSGALAKAQAAALRWRVQDKVTFDVRTTTDVGVLGPSKTTTWTATDRLCPWEISFSHNSLGGGERYGEEKAKIQLAQRRAQVEAAYKGDLDLLFAPAYLWPYLDPTNPDRPPSAQPEPTPIYVTSGPFGSFSNETPFDDNPNGDPITRIVVNAGARVDGIEVFYGGRSGGLHGARSGNTYSLDLGPGETIVSASGRGGDAMDALQFTTSTGRTVGGGGPGGTAWYAAPPQGSDGVLFKISGRQGGGHLATLNLTWTYVRYPSTAKSDQGSFAVTNQPVGVFGVWAGIPGMPAVTGDFAGTGRTSVALLGFGDWTTMPVAFSNGDGTFAFTNQPVQNFAAWAATPGAHAVVGHFDDSGRDSIALVGGQGWTTIPVAFSNGDGTFTVTNTPSPDFARFAAMPGARPLVGRFDDSGRDSIVLVGGQNWLTIPVAFSNGDGSFKTITNDNTAPYLAFESFASLPGVQVLTGDFAGTGRTSIALLVPGFMAVPVAFPNGDGSFKVISQNAKSSDDFVSLWQTPGAHGVVGHFDDSGRDSIALVGGRGSTTIPVAFSNGDGTFAVTNQTVDRFPGWAALPGAKVLVGDFTGSGRDALVLTGASGSTTIPIAVPTGGGHFTLLNPAVKDFPGWAATGGVKAFAGNFGGTGTNAIAATGGFGWATLPVAFFTPPPTSTAAR
jgi:jacalin-like lectin domain-containing protein